MKKNFIINSLGALCLFLVPFITVRGQDAEKNPLIVNVSYFTVNNLYPYLSVSAKSKISGRFQPIRDVEIKLYLDKDSTGQPKGYIGSIVTNEKGKGAIDVPPTVQQVWKQAPNHTFIAITTKSKDFDATNTELSVSKARLDIDTAADKMVTATFTEFKGGVWVPVKGVEVKLGIRRQGGDLLINDDQSYTTDSLGHVKGEFKRLGLPGDKDGNLVLVAKVEDNDTYGNLRIEKSFPWGARFVANSDFFTRALWGSQFHSPIWLVGIAYFIIISVWGTLIYLVFLLIKIKKLGQQEQPLK